MKIWIDADGCPIVDLAIRIAKVQGLPISVVKNHAIHIENTYAEIITVDISRDSADYYIVNHIATGDLVITQDNGLAAMVLAKRGKCLNFNGRTLDAQNIDFILDSRHQSREARMKKQKGPKHRKRTPQDDLDFEKALVRLIKDIQ